MSLNPNKHIYTNVYTEKNVSLDNVNNSYNSWFVDYYFSIVEKYGSGKDVLDLCCGSGSLLIPKLHLMKSAIGVDFSTMMLDSFKRKAQQPLPRNLKLILGDANYIPLNKNVVDFVYSITSLYHIPDVEKAILETARVLRTGGIAAFELGNSNSLNTIITDHYYKEQQWAKSFHISYNKMQLYIEQAGFSILMKRSFQLIPCYGVPRSLFYLRPIAGKHMRKVMGIKIGDRLFDEIISSTWLFRPFAFRHMFICQKN